MTPTVGCNSAIFHGLSLQNATRTDWTEAARVGDFKPNLPGRFRPNEATLCAHCGYMVKFSYRINYSEGETVKGLPPC